MHQFRQVRDVKLRGTSPHYLMTALHPNGNSLTLSELL